MKREQLSHLLSVAKFFRSPSMPFLISDFERIPPHREVASVNSSKEFSPSFSIGQERLEVVFLMNFVGSRVGW